MAGLESFYVIFKWVFSIVCYYYIFIKCNEKGFKSIIPIYSDYIKYKLFFSKKVFFVYLIALILFFVSGFIVGGIGAIEILNNGGSMTQEMMDRILLDNRVITFSNVMMFSMFVYFLLKLIMSYFTAKSFGKGFLFVIGIMVIPFICEGILAFSNAEYLGNLYGKNKKI